MRYPPTLGLLTAALLAGCDDLVVPEPAAPTIRIVGPSVGDPGDTVLLYAVATDPSLGAVPDSAIRWTVGTDTSFGALAALTLPPSGSLLARATVIPVRRDTASATHAVATREPGTLLWEAFLDGARPPSDILVSHVDGTVFVGGEDRLAAFSRSGALVWHEEERSMFSSRRQLGSVMHNGGFLWILALERDSVRALYPGRQRAWGRQLALRLAGIAPDGSVVGTDLDLVPFGSTIWHLGAQGDSLWRTAIVGGSPSWLALREDGGWIASFFGGPVVRGGLNAPVTTDVLPPPSSCSDSPRGVLPVGDDLVFVYPSGCVIRADQTGTVVRWEFRTAAVVLPEGIAIGPTGWLYLGRANGSVVAVSPEGQERWRSPPSTTACDSSASTAPALGADGWAFHHAPGELLAVDSTGTVRWRRPTVADGTVVQCFEPAPALTADGRVYVVTDRYRVRAFAAGVGADTTAVWDQHLGNAQRTRLARRPR